MNEKTSQERNDAIDNVYQSGSSFYDVVYAYAARALPPAEAAVIDSASSITGKIFGVGGIAVGALEGYSDPSSSLSNGAARGAVQSLGAIEGAKAGALLGAEAGAIIALPFPLAEPFTVPIGAAIGALAGGFQGMKLAGELYNQTILNNDFGAGASPIYNYGDLNSTGLISGTGYATIVTGPHWVVRLEC